MKKVVRFFVLSPGRRTRDRNWNSIHRGERRRDVVGVPVEVVGVRVTVGVPVEVVGVRVTVGV